MNDHTQKLYDEICALSMPEKVALYQKIAEDFEATGLVDDESAAVPDVNVHVPRWMYRILARWT